MHNAKVTCDELKSFYTCELSLSATRRSVDLTVHQARAAIEDEYARKMAALCRKPLGSSETGTLRASLDVMRGEVESMGKAHQAIAGQMKNELEEPLAAFAGGMKERRKIVQNGIEKLFKTKQQQTQAVNKVRLTRVTLRLFMLISPVPRSLRARLSQNQRLSSSRPYGHGPRGTQK